MAQTFLSKRRQLSRQLVHQAPVILQWQFAFFYLLLASIYFECRYHLAHPYYASILRSIMYPSEHN